MYQIDNLKNDSLLMHNKPTFPLKLHLLLKKTKQKKTPKKGWCDIYNLINYNLYRQNLN